jgi:peptide deformylase
MIEVMEAMPGYGLAAPQIGISQRLAVVDCSRERGEVVRLANPEIIWSSDERFAFDEASPNLPGMSARITRPREVKVRFLNDKGLPEERMFADLWSTSVQHQIDHLNGKLFFDHLSPLKRAMLLKKATKGKAA